MFRLRVLLLAALSGLVPFACKKKPPPPSPQPSEMHAAATPLPSALPSTMPVADFVGAEACRECHGKEYEKWTRSPHGRSMTKATNESVLANFDGTTVKLPDGSVTVTKDPDGFHMDVLSADRHDRRSVDFALASGRQHQIYVNATNDGRYVLLPIEWSTKTKEWLPLSLYQPGDLDPRSQNWFGAHDMTRGCLSCHVSQAHRKIGAAGGETHFVDSTINCESCHGPGREHIARRRAGRTDDVYRDLRALGTHDEARVCGGCHGFQLKPYVFPPASDGLPQVFVTSLINDSLRPDGTQRLTSYQYPGHVLSGGYRLEVLVCGSCHEPHDGLARDKKGRSAAGEQSNFQCTACHEELEVAKAAGKHSFHPPSVRCVDCHMSMSWIGDDPRRKQRTSDHSISIPRPRETLELGLPNACTTCHRDKKPEWAIAALEKWKQKQATVVREWVRTIAMARKMEAGATDRLIALAKDPTSVPYLKLSALDLLFLQPPEARVVAEIESFAHDSDPGLRASAIRALDHHDVAGRAKWRELGLSDAHPFVRMETFAMIKESDALSPAAIERNLSDVLAYMNPPTDGLVHLVTLRHKRHELREALDLLDLLQRVATEPEKRGLNLDAVRARIAKESGG